MIKMWIKTNRFVKWLFPKYIWDFPNTENKVYLTFDDGPIPEITPWVLNELSKFNVKATFFCIGENVQKHPEVFEEVLNAGHSIGNHTFNHLKGWETNNDLYFENFKKCESEIYKRTKNQVSLFRPPYGKIKNMQAKAIRNSGYKIIMWDVISMDFDQNISAEECLQNVVSNVTSGSIIVFHDSVKAFRNLEYTLPKTLRFLSEKGFKCESLD